MSYTKGTINNALQLPSGVFAAKVNGTATGTQISSWSGYYVTNDAGLGALLMAAALAETIVTIYGTESASTLTGFTAYETIAQVHVPGA